MITKNKTGLSGVITTVLLLLLTIVIVSVVIVAVKKLTTDPMENIEKCFDTFDKVNLNSRYTCYDFGANEFHFSIDVKNMKIDELLISISSETEAKTLKIGNGTTLGYLKEYGGTYGTEVFLPKENQGKTFVLNAIAFGIGEVTSIKIAPIVGGEQCEVTDSLLNIDSCSLID